MNADVHARHRSGQLLPVQDVSADEPEVRVADAPAVLQGVPMQVVVDDHFVRREESLDQVRPDETGATRDQNALPGKHANHPLRRVELTSRR